MTPDEKRAYDRARYAANRGRILAKRKAAYHADLAAAHAKNRAVYLRNKPAILERQKARLHSDPAHRAQRNAYHAAYAGSEENKAKRRRAYALARYGTETLPVRPKKVKPCSKPRPPKATVSKKVRSAFSARAANPSQRPKPSTTTNGRPPAAPPPTPPKPTWHPTPVSTWEPNLERQAMP